MKMKKTLHIDFNTEETYAFMSYSKEELCIMRSSKRRTIEREDNKIVYTKRGDSDYSLEFNFNGTYKEIRAKSILQLKRDFLSNL